MNTPSADAELHGAILRSTVFPLVATDLDGLIRAFNAGAEHLLRHRAVDVIGRRRFAELCEVPESAARIQASEEVLELMLVCGDGVRLPVTLAVSGLTDPQGVLIGYLLLAGDNRQHLRAERERVERDAQLRQSNKLEAIGTLAGGVAHDFNNILATILGNAELAREDAEGNLAVLGCIEDIRRAGIRGRDLVQQILSFARKRDTDLQPMSLEPVVRESVRLLRATLPGRLGIELECEPGLPPIAGDATQITQVLINLATNALQAMQAGPGRIHIRLATAALPEADAPASLRLREFLKLNPQGVASVSVRDTGCGMTPEVLPRIFDPFFTTRPPGEGTGLGLSVVHGIVQVHRGLIEVQSAPGQGTTFTLHFPLLRRAAVAPAPQADAAATPLRRTAGLRVLYLDDEDALVSLVPRLLERRGYRVTAFTDAERAIEALRRTPSGFDLVLTDYNMPMKSGLDVAREMLALRPDLPVAITTGYVDDTLRAQATALGVRDVIFKADTVNAFCDALQRVADSIPEKGAARG